MITKFCNTCQTEKSITDFNKNKSKKSGYNSQCRLCCKAWKIANKDYIKAYNTKYKKENFEYIKSYNEQYYEKNPEYLSNYRQRPEVKVQKVNDRNRRRAKCEKTDITNKWLVNLKNKSTHCGLCDCEMVNDGYRQNGKTIDHIVTLNTFGTHTMDNIRIICRKCNLSRPKDNRDVSVIFLKKFKRKHNIKWRKQADD